MLAPVLLAIIAALSVGERVTLYAPETDPQVLVFDHSPLVDAYRDWVTIGSDSSVSIVGRIKRNDLSQRLSGMVDHAFLVDPGTSAIIVQLRDLDVGVKITSGDFRGRYGWVRKETVHTQE